MASGAVLVAALALLVDLLLALVQRYVVSPRRHRAILQPASHRRRCPKQIGVGVS